jgi:hypothetical protein
VSLKKEKDTKRHRKEDGTKMEAEIGWMNLKQGKPRTDCNSSVAG